MSKDELVSLENLSYQYPRAADWALSNVNLTIHEGEFLALVGSTGAGKTTLSLTLNGIVPQFYGGRFFGHVTIAGLDTVTTPISLLAQHVAMVFQDPETQLIANTVEDEIAFTLENLRVPRDDIRRRITAALASVRLSGMERRVPADLSGGEKQRLAIAAAIAVQPRLLVLDEPTSQLDPLGNQEVLGVIRELNQRLGLAVVLISHASEELAALADRVVLLAGGEVLADEPPSRLFSRVKLLQEHGVRPPQVAQFYDLIAREDVPLPIPVTLDSAVQLYQSLRPQLTIDAKQLSHDDEPRSAATPILSAHELRYTYPSGVEALRGVSLDVQPGEYLAIAGHNGAGKTTLVKQFLRLLVPTAGWVCLDGTDVQRHKMSALAQRIGFVSQNPDDQIFQTTVEDEVSFALKNLGMRGPELPQRVAEALEAMGLLAQRSAHPLTLPKGDRARVIIAAVLAMHPEVLIFDEPTVGQDYRGAKRILDVTRGLHQAGKTIIVVSHHLYLLPGYAQRLVALHRGEIALDAPLRCALQATTELHNALLQPPQIVQFAQHIGAREGVSLPALTPEELAACVRWRADP